MLGVAFGVFVVVGGAVAYMSMRDTIAREDVGDHASLAPIQDQLAGLDACEIQYRTHRRMGKDQVLLVSCGEPRSTAWVSVPKGWSYPDFVFEARRDNAKRRWKVYVDKQRTSLDTLVDALGKLAPVLITDGRAALDKARASDRAWHDGQEARDKAAKDQTEKNRASYGN